MPHLSKEEFDRIQAGRPPMQTSSNMSAADYLKLGKKSKAEKRTVPQMLLGSGTANGITELIFAGTVPGNNGKGGLLRMHHRRKTELRDKYQYIVRSHNPKQHTGPVRLELIRHSLGSPMDYDNLVSTGKLLIDAIVLAGVLPDDKDTVIVDRSYTQTKALKRATQMTVIRIIDL